MFVTWCRWIFYLLLHKIVVNRHFHILSMVSQMAANGHVTISLLLVQIKVYVLTAFCESFTAIGRIVLEILCVEPIYPQYSGVLETCLALRY